MEKEIINIYQEKKDSIRKRLDEFRKLPEKEHFNEMIFCLLTPQSNAKKCWLAVQEVKKLKKWDEKIISETLRKYTRFHNNKTRYLILAKNQWPKIKVKLDGSDKKDIRNFLAENIKGYGLKEAGHFLRNIGKSNNEIAILDRHILRNLKELKVIKEEKIKNKKEYFKIEEKMIEYSKKINIPIDELDLLFWSKENGEIFK